MTVAQTEGQFGLTRTHNSDNIFLPKVESNQHYSPGRLHFWGALRGLLRRD